MYHIHLSISLSLYMYIYIYTHTYIYIYIYILVSDARKACLPKRPLCHACRGGLLSWFQIANCEDVWQTLGQASHMQEPIAGLEMCCHLSRSNKILFRTLRTAGYNSAQIRCPALQTQSRLMDVTTFWAHRLSKRNNASRLRIPLDLDFGFQSAENTISALRTAVCIQAKGQITR